jgi:uncharacterized FlgJ-related protein
MYRSRLIAAEWKPLIVALVSLLPVLSFSPALPAAGTSTPEVIVLSGLDQTRDWLQAEDWWGELKHEEQLTVPHALITGIPNRWRETAAKLTVSDKKEVFYRFLLPLILHANAMVMDRRALLETARATLAQGGALSGAELAQTREMMTLLRISGDAASLKVRGPEVEAVLDEALYKLDIIPPGLALGQAAYESGYGTSRFAAEGNALFGQWTFGGKGLKPEQQRHELGDHRIAAFDWPFDSVRSYFINLMSHPAYDDFRRIRAARRTRGEPLSSIALADGLKSYSERGQEYVDTLKGIIRVNQLEVADKAVLRNEPRRFLVGAESTEDAERLRAEIADLRRTGELDDIIDRMALD